MKHAKVLRGPRWAATPVEQNGHQDNLQEIAQEAFPYLEKVVVTAKKNPYAMLTIIVSIASVVIIAVTTLSLSIIGSVFFMYGKMSKIEATQEVILKNMEKTTEKSEISSVEAQHAIARQNYMVGLMEKKQQTAVNDYDRANPAPKPPQKEN